MVKKLNLIEKSTGAIIGQFTKTELNKKFGARKLYDIYTDRHPKYAVEKITE